MNDGTIILKRYKWKPHYYIADTLEDRKIIKFLGFKYLISEEDMDRLLYKASEYGFDVMTIWGEDEEINENYQ